MGHKFLLKLNIGTRPIANKIREGTMKSTLKRKFCETIEREACGISKALLRFRQFCLVTCMARIQMDPLSLSSDQNCYISLQRVSTDIRTEWYASSTVETGISDHHNLICTMLRSTFCKGPSKFIYYRSYNIYNKEQFKKKITLFVYLPLFLGTII